MQLTVDSELYHYYCGLLLPWLFGLLLRGCPHITSAAGGGGGGKPNADDC